MEFKDFTKIARLSREMFVTEKIDGTNGQIFITPRHVDFQDVFVAQHEEGMFQVSHDGVDYVMLAGSRNRWISPENDNAGFARWVRDNASELIRLGEGVHFGEWWGQGIQRSYGLKEKRFSLFNVSRWSDDAVRPTCCHVVPLLYQGMFDTDMIKYQLDMLELRGSSAAPGFMNPEGIVVYHVAANMYFKKTIKNDETPKSLIK